MKTVTQTFLDSLKAPGVAYVRQVFYKRRFWVESSKSYAWEANWTRVTEDNVVGVSQITWQLDIQTLNQFQTSNLTITLDNLNNRWKADNQYGLFGPDPGSPVYGYYPLWTKFQVQSGIIRSDGVTETVPVFTGVATEFNFDSTTGSVQITVAGEEALLINCNAEAVSNTVINETATGTVDGVNKVFTTAHTGVGIVSEVSDNGIAKRAGVDYTVSQLNDTLNPGKVSFAVAPLAGHTVRVSYIYWLVSQTFDALVKDLLNQAGIPGGSQNVSPVVFSSSVINTHVWQTQADWNGGLTLTTIDTVSIPDSIEYLYDAASTFNSSTAGWTDHNFDGQSTFTSDTSGLKFAGGAIVGFHLAYRAQSNYIGDWNLNYQEISGNNNADKHAFAFMANNVDTATQANGPWWFYHGYEIGLEYSSNTTARTITLYRADSAGVGGLVGIGSYSDGGRSPGTTFNFRVRRRPGGRFQVFLNNVLIISATDNTYTTSTYMGYGVVVSQSQYVYFLNTGFALPTAGTGLASWRSASVDFGTTPTAWAQFVFAQSLHGGATTYYTRSSADNISFDAWIAVPGNGAVQSTLRRYLQARVDIDITLGDPVVSNITVGSTTGGTVITLANFTGMTCWDAITALAKFANYEYGFAPDETFYFRPKPTVKVPVFSCDQATYNLQLRQIVNGYDRVYSAVRATYGSYIKDLVDDGLHFSNPTATAVFNRLDVDGGNILVSTDADVATGIAASFFNYFKYPRRRIKLLGKTLPQLDLSDVIQVTFIDNTPKGWYIGDNSVHLGDPSLTLYGAPEQLASSLVVKVIGQRADTDSWTTEFDLEEVL